MSRPILCIRLFGPHSSWGTEERGDSIRPTRRHPTRSALIGMAAAALGYGPENKEQFMSLNRGTMVAVCSHGPRSVVSEFRTSQPGWDTVGWEKMTRKQAIERKPGNASISNRESVEEGLWRVFFANTGDEGVPLHLMADAFRQPAFELCLGRREFPLSLPPDPMIVEGGLTAALRSYPAVPSFGRIGNLSWPLERLIQRDKSWEVHSDTGFPGVEGAPYRITKRPDDPFDPVTRTFRERMEEMRLYPTTSATLSSVADEFFPVQEQ